MPIGLQRFNAKKSQPNSHVVFIKPLNGPNEKVAQDFLERIAAQCLPVMRDHGLSVMTLEEFEPNFEFVGRNFNAGEVIQLVLKSPRTGRWLPFDYVQMVMMHELAHCKQMNHSRAFWAVRNQYASQMQSLWGKGYLGDGIWGRGKGLTSGEFERNVIREEDALPEHLCGGTYRTRGRKRRRAVKPELSYQEKKQRRIEKKFGKNGTALGADEDTKVKLERGKKVAGKPRVAGSNRGRELRAAAALARFDKQKVEEDDQKFHLKDESGSETDSGSDLDDEGQDRQDALDVDGSTMRDDKGRGMIKVCEDEDGNDPRARDEMAQLRNMFKKGIKKEGSPGGTLLDAPDTTSATQEQQSRQAGTSQQEVKKPREPRSLYDIPLAPQAEQACRGLPLADSQSTASTADTPGETNGPGSATACPICSFANQQHAATCVMCANVLDPRISKDAWRCKSKTCHDTEYYNSGDCGVCGLCGQRRLSSSS